MKASRDASPPPSAVEEKGGRKSSHSKSSTPKSTDRRSKDSAVAVASTSLERRPRSPPSAGEERASKKGSHSKSPTPKSTDRRSKDSTVASTSAEHRPRSPSSAGKKASHSKSSTPKPGERHPSGKPKEPRASPKPKPAGKGDGPHSEGSGKKKPTTPKKAKGDERFKIKDLLDREELDKEEKKKNPSYRREGAFKCPYCLIVLRKRHLMMVHITNHHKKYLDKESDGIKSAQCRVVNSSHSGPRVLDEETFSAILDHLSAETKKLTVTAMKQCLTHVTAYVGRADTVKLSPMPQFVSFLESAMAGGDMSQKPAGSSDEEGDSDEDGPNQEGDSAAEAQEDDNDDVDDDENDDDEEDDGEGSGGEEEEGSGSEEIDSNVASDDD